MSPLPAASAAPLVLGTTNAGKVRELQELLLPLGITCRSLAEFPAAVDVEETGQTFAENAALKATLQARALGQWVLAEDSGLVVGCLGGAPGILSARYSGAGATDTSNITMLLKNMLGSSLNSSDRSAHYACHAALANPQGEVVATAWGNCGGVIATAPAGRGGFGYDPLFIVPEYHRTFGEIAPAVKALISHRARALRALLPAIQAHLAPG